MSVDKSKQYFVIDDTWNASPASAIAALKMLSSFSEAKKIRRIVFLGDMLQLGSDEVKKHEDLAEWITTLGIDKVFTVGILTKNLFDVLPKSLRGCHFLTAIDAASYCGFDWDNNDVVLVKGSNAMEMWRVVKKLRELPKAEHDTSSVSTLSIKTPSHI